MMRNVPRDCAVFGVDVGKTVFHVVGLDRAGAPVQKAKFRRDMLLRFVERTEQTLVAMEACPGSQWLARRVRVLGHEVRIVPAQFVKPYVKSHKNDVSAGIAASAPVRPTPPQNQRMPGAAMVTLSVVPSVDEATAGPGDGFGSQRDGKTAGRRDGGGTLACRGRFSRQRSGHFLVLPTRSPVERVGELAPCALVPAAEASSPGPPRRP